MSIQNESSPLLTNPPILVEPSNVATSPADYHNGDDNTTTRSSQCQHSYGRIGILILLSIAVLTLFEVLKSTEKKTPLIPEKSPMVIGNPKSLMQSISTNAAPFDTGAHIIKPQMLSSSSLTKPVPTNAWWTNFLIADGTGQHAGEGPVTVMPYTVSSSSLTGLSVSYGDSRRTVTNVSISEKYNSDISFSVIDSRRDDNIVAMSRSVVEYDPLSVTLEYKKNDTTVFTTTLVRGCPYVTVSYEASHPKISFNNTITNVSALNQDGTVFQVTTDSGSYYQHWMLFASSKLEFKRSLNVLETNSSSFTGTIRAAIIPHDHSSKSQEYLSPAQLSVRGLLTLHSSIIPVSSKIDTYMVEEDIATVEFSYETKSTKSWNDDASLLMVGNPHQVATIKDEEAQQQQLQNMLCYRTMKGNSTFITGNTWKMNEELTNISFNAPTGVASQDLKDEIIKSLLEDAARNNTPSKTDPYFFGKEIAKVARLALIADEYRQNETRDNLLQDIKTWIEPWLRGSNDDHLRYDTVWKGLCSKNGLAGVLYMTDFGNGWYSDHHFHYGYLIYTAAVIGKFDPDFVKTHAEPILAIVRDIANPSDSDPYFPLTRYFSWFDGHSFASGVFELDGGKSQESVSEAINAYYAVYLLGTSLQDDQLKNFGRLLLAMEMRAAKTYWQMPSGSSIYEDSYARANKMTGQVAATKVVYTTWFGPLVENMHLINMIPFTPITEAFLSREFMAQEYPILQAKALERTSLPLITEGFRGYAYMAHAIIDPEAAWKEISTISTFDDGNSRTNALYWIATRGREV